MGEKIDHIRKAVEGIFDCLVKKDVVTVEDIKVARNRLSLPNVISEGALKCLLRIVSGSSMENAFVRLCKIAWLTVRDAKDSAASAKSVVDKSILPFHDWKTRHGEKLKETVAKLTAAMEKNDPEVADLQRSLGLADERPIFDATLAYVGLFSGQAMDGVRSYRLALENRISPISIGQFTIGLWHCFGLPANGNAFVDPYKGHKLEDARQVKKASKTKAVPIEDDDLRRNEYDSDLEGEPLKKTRRLFDGIERGMAVLAREQIARDAAEVFSLLLKGWGGEVPSLGEDCVSYLRNAIRAKAGATYLDKEEDRILSWEETIENGRFHREKLLSDEDRQVISFKLIHNALQPPQVGGVDILLRLSRRIGCLPACHLGGFAQNGVKLERYGDPGTAIADPATELLLNCLLKSRMCSYYERPFHAKFRIRQLLEELGTGRSDCIVIYHPRSDSGPFPSDIKRTEALCQRIFERRHASYFKMLPCTWCISFSDLAEIATEISDWPTKGKMSIYIANNFQCWRGRPVPGSERLTRLDCIEALLEKGIVDTTKKTPTKKTLTKKTEEGAGAGRMEVLRAIAQARRSWLDPTTVPPSEMISDDEALSMDATRLSRHVDWRKLISSCSLSEDCDVDLQVLLLASGVGAVIFANSPPALLHSEVAAWLPFECSRSFQLVSALSKSNVACFSYRAGHPEAVQAGVTPLDFDTYVQELFNPRSVLFDATILGRSRKEDSDAVRSHLVKSVESWVEPRWLPGTSPDSSSDLVAVVRTAKQASMFSATKSCGVPVIVLTSDQRRALPLVNMRTNFLRSSKCIGKDCEKHGDKIILKDCQNKPTRGFEQEPLFCSKHVPELTKVSAPESLLERLRLCDAPKCKKFPTMRLVVSDDLQRQWCQEHGEEVAAALQIGFSDDKLLGLGDDSLLTTEPPCTSQRPFREGDYAPHKPPTNSSPRIECPILDGSSMEVTMVLERQVASLRQRFLGACSIVVAADESTEELLGRSGARKLLSLERIGRHKNSIGEVLGEILGTKESPRVHVMLARDVMNFRAAPMESSRGEFEGFSMTSELKLLNLEQAMSLGNFPLSIEELLQAKARRETRIQLRFKLDALRMYITHAFPYDAQHMGVEETFPSIVSGKRIVEELTLFAFTCMRLLVEAMEMGSDGRSFASVLDDVIEREHAYLRQKCAMMLVDWPLLSRRFYSDEGRCCPVELALGKLDFPPCLLTARLAFNRMNATLEEIARRPYADSPLVYGLIHSAAAMTRAESDLGGKNVSVRKFIEMLDDRAEHADSFVAYCQQCFEVCPKASGLPLRGITRSYASNVAALYFAFPPKREEVRKVIRLVISAKFAASARKSLDNAFRPMAPSGGARDILDALLREASECPGAAEISNLSIRKRRLPDGEKPKAKKSKTAVQLRHPQPPQPPLQPQPLHPQGEVAQPPHEPQGLQQLTGAVGHANPLLQQPPCPN